MKSKFFVMVILITTSALFLGCTNINVNKYLRRNTQDMYNYSTFESTMESSIDAADIVLVADGREYSTDKNIYMNDNLVMMISVDIIIDLFDCALNIYNGTDITIQKNSDRFVINIDSGEITYNGESVDTDITLEENENGYFLPVTIFTEWFDYTLDWDGSASTATLINRNADGNALPDYYSYIDSERAPAVKNQGSYGTCWAFAALTALESTLLPEENLLFSEDHMSMSNSYGLSQDSGGDYTISIAYLAAWQGPVYESDDPYGDGITNSEAQVAKHVQEVRVIDEKDYDKIKEMIFKYGGVQSSLYTSLRNSESSSYYYNKETSAYCYIGSESANHDIVIIGWDDNYSADNFSIDVEGDGAFICQNSWGEEFGDSGIFYVSYYDTNIGVHNVVYTKVEDTDNYDNIYQSDLCGWTGSLGFEANETAYFANVFTGENDEELVAVSFYAPVYATEYEVYVCTDYESIASLNVKKEPAASGTFTESGYYTVSLDRAYAINGGDKYAVIVKLYTPDCEKPIAVEYKGGEQMANVDLSDGEGYFSLYGSTWKSAEENNCNLCLKAFTNNRQ